MSRKIEFYMPKNKTVPTNLAVKVDDKLIVNYERVKGRSSYEFYFDTALGAKKAREIALDIAHKISYESYDHGAEWRILGSEIDDSDPYCITVTVDFRWKDSY